MGEKLQVTPREVRALLFDFGGVLVDLDMERYFRAFDELGIDMRPFIGTYKQSGILSAFERGQVNTHEFCSAIRSTFAKPELTDETIVAAWEQFLVDVPENRLQLLLKAKQHYHLSLLSNTNPVHWALGRERYFRYNGHEVHDFFDETFLSYELGVEKPSPLIFEKVRDGLSFVPSEVLFFDDSPVNCAAARALGFQAVEAKKDGEWLKFFDENGFFRGE